jgi:hypothetical protein
VAFWEFDEHRQRQCAESRMPIRPFKRAAALISQRVLYEPVRYVTPRATSRTHAPYGAPRWASASGAAAIVAVAEVPVRG